MLPLAPYPTILRSDDDERAVLPPSRSPVARPGGSFICTRILRQTQTLQTNPNDPSHHRSLLRLRGSAPRSIIRGALPA